MANPYNTFAGSSAQFKIAHGLELQNNTAIKIGTSLHNGLLFEIQMPILKKLLINGQISGFAGFMD